MQVRILSPVPLISSTYKSRAKETEIKVSLVSNTKINKSYLTRLMKDHVDNEEFIKNVQTPEGLAIYCARVSSPNQVNAEYEKLLKYCAKNSHWSVFEMIEATFEVETSRAISAQILRHKSFCFQEFSQRYAEVPGIEIYEARRQDDKNRQNSIDDMSEEDKKWFLSAQETVARVTRHFYDEALARDIAKEQARFLLPMASSTRLFMKGSLRSWIHYLKVRTDLSTQKEHRDIVLEIQRLLSKEYPVIADAMEWNKES